MTSTAFISHESGSATQSVGIIPEGYTKEGITASAKESGVVVSFLELENDIEWDFRKLFPDAQKVKVSQNLWEFDQLINWLKREWNFEGMNKQFKYLEIGSYAGESLFYLSQIFPRNSYIALVDLGDNHLARANLMKVIEWAQDKYGHYIQLVTGDSRDPSMIETIGTVAPFDLLFIDANHEFDFAVSDYRNYSSLAMRVFMHDVSRDTVERTKLKYGYYKPEVGHLWESIKATVNQHDRAIGEGGEEIVLDNWIEIVDNKTELKSRGFGIIYGGKFG